MPTNANQRARQIRAGQKAAARELSSLLNQHAAELRGLYGQALTDMQRELAELVDSDGRIPIDRLPQAERIIEHRLRVLSRDKDAIISGGIRSAAGVGANPWSVAVPQGIDPGALADGAAQFVREFRDQNGLQLSDRLWRVDRRANERVITAVEEAIVQGNSAHQAARDMLLRGEPIPPDLLSKRGQAAIRNIQARMDDALITGEGNPYYNAERVMRTEMNRAFGHASVEAAAEHPQVRAVRFTLSPHHPEPDICDFHAEANLHGLGPGVYPIDNHPWPAHPNTLSYLEPIFVDEITDEDRAGKETMTDYLNNQPAAKQDQILGGQAKGWAWRQGHLDPRQMKTPWHKVKPRLQRRGIDIPPRFSA